MPRRSPSINAKKFQDNDDYDNHPDNVENVHGSSLTNRITDWSRCHPGGKCRQSTPAATTARRCIARACFVAFTLVGLIPNHFVASAGRTSSR